MKRLYTYIGVLLLIVAAYSCAHLKATNHVEGEAFEYRDIYLPTTSDKELSELKLNSLDNDWGIWGHNLGNVLPEDPSMTVYADIGEGPEKEQFCFTSTKLFKYICDFIEHNYGRHDSIRFAIVPNDNTMACLCEECVAIGNTKGHATPAVYDMVEKLANKYPNHTFFTSHYLTTSKLPERQLPKNTGVLVSAMDYPLTTAATPEEDKFRNMLGLWKGKTDRVYVWDYINNFDDYFTPFPVFNVMQRRLKMYKDAGVDGVFLNGSGEDYSAFSRLKKGVLAQMLINPDIDWEEELRELCDRYYPVAGDDIADFIIAQEKMVAANGKKLPMYEGVAVARKTYLPEGDFIDFYNKIQDHKKVANGWEKQELETLAEALSLTMLEIKRINGKVDDDGHLVKRVKRLAPKGIEVYNEGCWSIAQYLENYAQLMQNFEETDQTNLLKGQAVKPLVALDEDYTDISIITDGLLGIPTNYHSGNLISSADPALKLQIPRVEGMKKLKVWLSYHPGFKIGLPQDVSLTVGGTKVATKEPPHPAGHTGHSIVEFDIPAEGEIILTLTKNPDVKTMAIEEIQGFAE